MNKFNKSKNFQEKAINNFIKIMLKHYNKMSKNEQRRKAKIKTYWSS